MRARDPVVDDLRTFAHEAGHVVAAVLHGGDGTVVRVAGHRHHAGDGERGFVEYLRRGMSDWQDAFICLAGIACSEGHAVLLNRDTQDERDALELIGPDAIEPLRRAVYAWSQRGDVERAVIALSAALMEEPVLPGITAERIVRAAFDQRRRRPA